ncbi:MAG: aminoacyl-tRNA hydrolase [Alphaproteobacteria bacterium]|nr:aminoacyl-tRNA hydrolase [Alphaproteobacteria bacterium]
MARAADIPLLIAGLGNPGSEYARNRHNVGFMAIDEIHDRHRFGPFKTRFRGDVAEGTLAGRKAFLLKPLTFMNESGIAVGAFARFYKLPLAAIVVIHDDLDLIAGKLKVKTGGGDAGHNGLRSITSALGPDYRRLRIGIGHPGHKERVYGHVLGNFSRADEDWLVPLLHAIAEAGPLLAEDDDAGFVNKVTLLTARPAKAAGTPPRPKDT